MDTQVSRIGALSALSLGASYVAITTLYVTIGAPPDALTEKLSHFADHGAVWWAILALSVATDLLFLPVIWALYHAMRRHSPGTVLSGAMLVALFVVLDLAVTWPNYAVLISFGSKAAAAGDEAGRAALLAGAGYASEVVGSGLFGVYAILVPGAGIFLMGLAMLRSGFGRVAGWLGVATGVLALVAIAGPVFLSGLGVTAILASVATTAWVIVAGIKLLR